MLLNNAKNLAYHPLYNKYPKKKISYKSGIKEFVELMNEYGLDLYAACLIYWKRQNRPGKK